MPNEQDPSQKTNPQEYSFEALHPERPPEFTHGPTPTSLDDLLPATEQMPDLDSKISYLTGARDVLRIVRSAAFQQAEAKGGEAVNVHQEFNEHLLRLDVEITQLRRQRGDEHLA